MMPVLYCRAVALMGEMRNAYKILFRKLEGKRLLRKPGIDRRII
jgi:hypothetical protein